MRKKEDQICKELKAFINDRAYPCIAAKAAVHQSELRIKVAADMGSANADREILTFIYSFTENYRNTKDTGLSPYQSACIIFRQPKIRDEEMYDNLMWQRLQALADLDSESYPFDTRVIADPESAAFSFSLMEEAFFIIGLHPMSSRAARKFQYPTLVFNPHAQFEKLRQQKKYDPMKKAIRKRDLDYSGSVNPMLRDFGDESEVYQYSGRQYQKEWRCPLKIDHGKT